MINTGSNQLRFQVLKWSFSVLKKTSSKLLILWPELTNMAYKLESISQSYQNNTEVL